jgi:hypothetical protein
MVNKQGEKKMGLKSFDYYNTVPYTYPSRDDYKKVFVYSKGKTIVNGVPRSQISAEDLKDYRAKGYSIEEDFDKTAFYAESNKYSDARNKLEAEFKADLFDEHGVTGHPKANRAFDIAWDHGHSSGYSEVANYFDDLADLLKP